MNADKLSFFQKAAWVYAVMFVFIASLAYIPGLADDDGVLFGLFSLDIWDDLLHLGSGIWAGVAAYLSTRASINYFRLFGLIYGLDGVVGLLLGQAFLDAGLLIYGPTPLPFTTRLFANLPHILIGGIAVLIGFYLTRVRPVHATSH